MSYAEFLDFHRRQDSDESLERYLRYGGLPYLAHLPESDAACLGYLEAIVDTVVLRDVIERFSVRNASFLIHRCQRYDIQGRRLFEVGEKIYFEDLGLRTALRGWRQADLGKVMENAVYLKLVQDGWKPAVGVLGGREIDFVATRGADTVYVQVAMAVSGEQTREREFGNLLYIDDNHPKYVVSLDAVRADERGVRHLSLREFLLCSL